MGKVRCVALAGALGGCSLIYNPSNLPSPPGEAAVTVDAEVIIDADPSHLELTTAFPPAIDEGAGIDGSRPALLVITGKNIIPGAQITLARTGGGATTATVDNTQVVVAADGNMIAVPIKVDIDPALGPKAGTASYTLDVTVTQVGTITKTLPAAIRVAGYDELGPTDPPVAGTYSRVMLTAAFTPGANAAPFVIRSSSSITIGGAITAKGGASTPGPGGGAGGTSGQPGMGLGGGKANGGGGGYATPGTGAANNGAGGAGNLGDAALRTLASPNRSSGGAGGGALTGGTPGLGGGGGGTVELSARGNLSIAGVAVDGGNGGLGTGGLTTATDGGGGSGGVALLRAGGTFMVTGPVTATGGKKPAGSTSAGDGGDGRIRFDAPVGATLSSTPGAYRGPMFAADTPLIFRTKVPTIAITCQANAPFTYFILDEDGSLIEPLTSPLTCGPQGKESIDLDAKGSPLSRGLNHICLLVDGAARTDELPEDRNCVDVAFIYLPPTP